MGAGACASEILGVGPVAFSGSWMPGTNEVFGCPPTKKNISPYQFMSKISDDLFSVISPNFYFFFLSIFLDAPLILDARGRSSLFTHLPLLFRHLPMRFFRKLRRWMLPGWMPSHPPLHATAWDSHQMLML